MKKSQNLTPSFAHSLPWNHMEVGAPPKEEKHKTLIKDTKQGTF